MLARELAMALCPSVSITSPCAIERDGQTDLVFGTEASFDQSYSMFKEIHVFTKSGTSLWNFFLNPGLRKFRHDKSMVLSRKLEKLVDGRRRSG